MPLLVFALALLTAPARAADTWTEVRPGVDWLHRTTGGSVPQDLHAVRIDLTRETIGLRASTDESGSERHVTTSTFARHVGALVAINGDWSDGNTPVGLAIGNGWKWRDHYDDAEIGDTWGFFACDVFNGCAIDALPVLSEAWWFSQPTIAPYRYANAVGANGLLLYDEGARLSGCYDGCDGDTCRNPRSAVCLDQAGTTLWFFAVDGRRSGASGMTCGETRDLVAEFDCWNAAMLDGGGSTTMWIDGAVRNDPSDGDERVVANHVGLVYADAVDPACRYAAGAWCEGTVLHTCNGGRLVIEGDCGAFGWGCQQDGEWAFCVDPRCPGGDGTAHVCLDATRIAGCTDGNYGEGDCGAFGLVCGTDDEGSSCMDGRCQEGPHSSFCLDETTLAACTDGVYAQTTCPEGENCVGGGGDARCEGPGDSGDSDPGGTDSGDPDSGGGRQGFPPGAPRENAEAGGCGCAGGRRAPAGLGGLVLALLAVTGAGLSRSPRTPRATS